MCSWAGSTSVALIVMGLVSSCASFGPEVCPAVGLAGGLEVEVAVGDVAAVPDAARLCLAEDCVAARLVTEPAIVARREIPAGTSGRLKVRLQLLVGDSMVLDSSGFVTIRSIGDGTGRCRQTATVGTARYDPTTRRLVTA